VVKDAMGARRYRNAATVKDRVSSAGKKAVRLARLTYTVLVLGVIVPIGVALAVDLYVLIPLKYGASDMTPVFYVQEAW
jgi:hypothetical protein